MSTPMTPTGSLPDIFLTFPVADPNILLSKSSFNYNLTIKVYPDGHALNNIAPLFVSLHFYQQFIKIVSVLL